MTRLTHTLCMLYFIPGCSLVLDIDRPQCTVDADCSNNTKCVRGWCSTNCEEGEDCGSAEEWSCVKAAEPRSQIDITLPLVDLSQNPLAEIEVELCWILDVQCAEPETRNRSDEKGFVEVTLPREFEGFLRLTHPERYPVLFFVPDVLPDPTTPLAPVPIPTPMEATSLLQLVDAPVDQRRGTVFVTSRSCQGNDGPGGLQFSLLQEDPQSLPFYMSGLPVLDVEATVAGDGRGGFANAQSGPATVVIKLKGTGEELGRRPLIVRAGHLSVVTFAY